MAVSTSGGGRADCAAERGEQPSGVGRLPGGSRAGGRRATAAAATRRREPAPIKHSEPDDRAGLRDRIGRASRPVIDAIHEHFDLLAYARQHFPGEQQRQGDEVRITGHGGLLLKPEAGVWFCHRETIGGDWLDLVGYRQHGVHWERQDKEMFRAALREAAAFAGVPLPRGNGHVRAGLRAVRRATPQDRNPRRRDPGGQRQRPPRCWR